MVFANVNNKHVAVDCMYFNVPLSDFFIENKDSKKFPFFKVFNYIYLAECSLINGVSFQNYSLMENDRVTPYYALTGWRNGIQIRLRGTFEDEACVRSPDVRELAIWDLSIRCRTACSVY
jgi:hypothetical protein